MAVILNATAVIPAGQGWLTVYPTGTALPLASDLKCAPGEVRPNLLVGKVGPGGKVSPFPSITADVILDVAEYFVP